MTEQARFEFDPEVDNMPGTPERPTMGETFESVAQRAMSRRAMLKGAVATSATFAITPGALVKSAVAAPAAPMGDPGDRLTFETVPPGDGSEPDVRVPPNYEVDVVLRWGDPLFPGAPALDLNNQTGATQAQQFGYNCDLVLWYPVPFWLKRWVERTGRLVPFADWLVGIRYPRLKTRYSRRAVVAVNHEYTKGSDMFPGYDSSNPTRDQVEAEIEAHGFSIVELKQNRRGQWEFQKGSAFTRRITGSTQMDIMGPLRGHDLMKTDADPSGTVVLGCLNNCAGGKTPWGTVITCEENFDQYFANFSQATPEVQALSTRLAAPSGSSGRKWERFVDRFDLSTDSQEYHRFGYLVEIDPYDPEDRPKKRTACGRFKHEGAACNVSRSGAVAVYSRRRRPLRVRLQVRVQRPLQPLRSRPQQDPARRRHPLRGALRRRRHRG